MTQSSVSNILRLPPPVVPAAIEPEGGKENPEFLFYRYAIVVGVLTPFGLLLLETEIVGLA